MFVTQQPTTTENGYIFFKFFVLSIQLNSKQLIKYTKLLNSVLNSFTNTS